LRFTLILPYLYYESKGIKSKKNDFSAQVLPNEKAKQDSLSKTQAQRKATRMNILDNNPFDSEPEEIDAEHIMSHGMGHIWSMCIEPMIDQGNLSDEDRSLIGCIGLSFKIIAQNAKCYEELQQGEHNDPKENEFYRN
jgi:hypothetical protein